MFEKLGRFEIKGLLGNGAMGEVYLGVDPSIGREVAIKTILARNAAGDEARLRLAREAKAAGLLSHPNIVTVHEFGEDQGVLYIAMERVKGQDLQELLRQRCLDPVEILEVLAQVCDGLGFAHRNHIIHRDIKPSNVRVLRDGHRITAKIMDFGVARMRDSESTSTGIVVGTVSYMAPEYIRTGKPDGRSDLFAVGVMLYECMAGRRPFEGDTTPTILYRIVNEPPDPLDLSGMTRISPSIRNVLEKALAKNPDARYQTADELAHALRAAKDPGWRGHGAKTGSLPESPRRMEVLPPLVAQSMPTAGVPRPWQARSRWMLATVLAAAAGSGALAGGAILYYRSNPSGRSRAKVHAPARGTALSATRLSTPAGTATVAAESTSQTPPAPSPASPGATSPETTTAAGAEMPGAPSPGSKNLVHLLLSDAVRAVDSDPGKAVENLRQVIAAEPGNVGAHAWLVVALHEGGRSQEIPGAIGQAKRHGITKAMLSNNLRFRMLMQEEQARQGTPGGTGGSE